MRRTATTFGAFADCGWARMRRCGTRTCGGYAAFVL